MSDSERSSSAALSSDGGVGGEKKLKKESVGLALRIRRTRPVSEENA